MARETMEATVKLAGITASDLSDAPLHVQHSYVYILNHVLLPVLNGRPKGLFGCLLRVQFTTH